MLKKLLVIVLMLLLMLFVLWVVVDVNIVDYVVLEMLFGIGFKCFKLIIEECIKNGLYKDVIDFKVCVVGIGDKMFVKLENEGLIFGVLVLVLIIVKKDGKDVKKK